MPNRWFDGKHYKREVTINYMDCNTEKNVFLHYILGTFSEIAGDEALAKGTTYESLKNRDTVFLITRMSVRFHKLPKCDDTIIFTTWFRTTEGKFYLRDCDVRSPEGELLASLSGTWVRFDISERKVLDPRDYSNLSMSGFSEKADSPECKKVVSEDTLPVLGYRPVYYTDLDCNYHINNSVYTRIATDFLPEALRALEVADYVVNFLKETSIDDTLEIRGGETQNGYIIQGLCEGVPHFACEFTFKK